MASFTEKEEAKLIKIVASNPVLYDKSHASYRNILTKDYVWKTIGTMLNKNSDDCKRKWKALRDCYKRYKRTHHLGDGSAAPKQSKDKRHRQLSFIDNFDPNCEYSNLPLSPVQENIEEIDDIENQFSANEQEGFKEGVTSGTEQNKDNDESSAPATSVLVTSDQTTKSENAVIDNQTNKNVKKEILILRRRKKRDKKRHIIKSLMKKKDDDVELFLRHMGEVLRKLPAVGRAQAKKQLNTVLSDYEIKAAKLSSKRQSSSYRLNSNSSSDVETRLSSDLSSSEDSVGPMDTDLYCNLPGSSSASHSNQTDQLPRSVHHSSFKVKEELGDPLQ